MSLKKLFFVATAVITSALLIGCHGSRSRSHHHFSRSWYDVYGDHCGYGQPRPGCNFYANGQKITDIEDPYFGRNNVFELRVWYYYDSYGFYKSYYGWGWESPTGIIYDEWGNALNSQDGQGRDFMADVAASEANIVKSAGEMFAKKYQLDEAVGIKVAQVLNDWATLGRDRARTDADIADFTERLYGIDFNRLKAALTEYQRGQAHQLEELVDEAATNWNTTPETMKEILKTWYGDAL